MKSKITFFLILIVCATVVFYITFWTKDRFISQSQFSVVVEDTSNVDASLGALSLLTNGSRSNIDVQSAIGFIHSADMLLELEKEFDLEKHFTSPEKDVVYRLEREPSLEARLEYYRERIIAKYSTTSGLIDLSVETFDPELSFKVSKSILSRTEKFINDLNQSVAQKRLQFVKLELKRAEEAVKNEEQALLAFRNKHHVVNPEAITLAKLESIQSLRMEKIGKEVELSTIRSTSPKSPLINALSTTIKNLENEIKNLEALLAGPSQEQMNAVLAKHKDLQLRLSFSLKLKEGAEILLEKTRAEAIAHSRFFAVIQKPILAEEYTNPRRLYLSVTLVCVILISFYILRALVMSIYDRS